MQHYPGVSLVYRARAMIDITVNDDKVHGNTVVRQSSQSPFATGYPPFMITDEDRFDYFGRSRCPRFST